MKYHYIKYSLFLLFAVSYSTSLFSQITIDDTDFADAGDTARMTEAIWNPLLDFGATDTNYVWNFSDLQWQNQYIDTFRTLFFLSPAYSFTFSNTLINPYRSNIAVKGDNILTNIPIVSGLFSNSYNFFYKTTSSYRQKGIGVTMSGFPTAVPMTHADTLYHFPMNYGDEDSCLSDFTVRVPQLGTIAHRQKRINKVDGWGTLITPFGTFDALRMRTEIQGADSLYVDTLNFGFSLSNDIKREYKWFGKGYEEPLLTIFTQAGILGQFQSFEFVTKIIYRDSVRFIPEEPSSAANLNDGVVSISVYPNPSNGLFYIAVPSNLTNVQLTISDINGKAVLNRALNDSIDVVNAEAWPKGIYILTIQSAEGVSSKKLVLD